MRRWRPPQPDLFTTPPPHDLLPSQRTTAVKLLKVLLSEVMSAAPAGSEGLVTQEADDDQDHG